MKEYKHLYFDLDRTLWDFDSNSGEALLDIYNDFNLDRFFDKSEDFVSAYHFHNEKLWDDYRKGALSKEVLRSERFLLTLKGNMEGKEELARIIGEKYLEISVLKTRLFPCTHEILTYLRDKSYHLYLLTNGFRETQFSKLQNCDLGKYFEKVFTSETIGVNKPNPEIFHWAISSVNAKKAECLMIGDDQAVDIQGAKDFGIDTVFFNPDEEPIKCQPDYEIRNLCELKNIL